MTTDHSWEFPSFSNSLLSSASVWRKYFGVVGVLYRKLAFPLARPFNGGAAGAGDCNKFAPALPLMFAGDAQLLCAAFGSGLLQWIALRNSSLKIAHNPRGCVRIALLRSFLKSIMTCKRSSRKEMKMAVIPEISSSRNGGESEISLVNVTKPLLNHLHEFVTI